MIGKLSLCGSCFQQLPWLHNVCHQCAQPLLDVTNPQALCGACLLQAPYYDNTVGLFYYQSPLDQLIGKIKFHQQLQFAQLLGELLADRVVEYYHKDAKPDCIIPVPLHKQRLRERGYNQAVELARPAAKKLALPLLLHNCQRLLCTPPQSSLPARLRHRNVRNAFIAKPMSVQHVAIIDDVVTTGSTVNELSRALKQQGIKRVDVWCCARTVTGFKK